MRTLIVGMQSSGASWVAFNLAQKKPMISIIDLYHRALPPPECTTLDDCIVKCVVTHRHSLETIYDIMQPHECILVTRNRADTENSLRRKSYARMGGTITSKFKLYHNYVEQAKSDSGIFTGIIAYEDFHPVVIRRTLSDILWYNCKHLRWCQKYFGSQWGFGSIHHVPEVSADLRTTDTDYT